MKNVTTQPWVYGLAMIAAMMVGCEGANISVPLNIGNPEIDIETGDVDVNVETNVTQIQNVRIGDNIMIQGGTTVAAVPPQTLSAAEEDEIVVRDEVPECIPVDEITEDQLIEVCIPLQPEFLDDELEFVYLQFEGLEGATQIPAASLEFRDDGVCFDINFVGDLGMTEDPIAALGGLSGVGNAIDCIYYLETAAGVTGGYETLIVQDGSDCGPGDSLDDDFEELEPTDG